MASFTNAREKELREASAAAHAHCVVLAAVISDYSAGNSGKIDSIEEICRDFERQGQGTTHEGARAMRKRVFEWARKGAQQPQPTADTQAKI